MEFQPRIESIKEITRRIVEMFVAGQFAELDLMTNSKVCPAEDFMYWFREDHRQLVLCLPPDKAFEDVNYLFLDDREWTATEPFQSTQHNLTVIEVADGSWHVDFELWVHPIQRSEYTLQFSLSEDAEDNLIPELENLHIM